MPTLWKMDLSPPACAVRVLGDILGIQFDLIDVDFANMEHKSPEFKKINPLGTVPVLKDGDFILTDSHAIHKYLLEKYGTAKQKESLYPRDLTTQAIIDQAMYFDAAVFFIKLKVIALPSLFEGLTGPTPRHLSDIEEAYSVVEAYLGDKGYIAAKHFTLADLAVGVTTASMQCYLKVDSNKCLLVDRKLHYSPVLARITSTCCVLHNIAHRAHIPYAPLMADEVACGRRLTDGSTRPRRVEEWRSTCSLSKLETFANRHSYSTCEQIGRCCPNVASIV